MADYFFDTSGLAKRYHAEVGTPEVEQLLQEAVAEGLPVLNPEQP
jgi:hypothetical protein